MNATVVPFYRSVPYDNRAAGTCKFSGRNEGGSWRSSRLVDRTESAVVVGSFV